MRTHVTIDSLPSNYTVAFIGDVHVGARVFNQEAFIETLRKIRARKHAYIIGMGDYVEGQSVKHPHYEREAIGEAEGQDGSGPKLDLHTPGGQFRHFENLITPAMDRILGLVKGNHDWRYDDVDALLKNICIKNELYYLGPTASMSIGPTNVFIKHVGERLPKGAKDDIQRDANRRAALRRNLEDQWGSAHFMAYGHTHDLLVAKPTLDPWKLISGDGEHRMRRVPWEQMGTSVVDEKTGKTLLYTDPRSRWYANTGTFRREGLVNDITADYGAQAFDDYGSKFGYTPRPIGYVEMEVRKDRIVDAREVFI